MKKLFKSLVFLAVFLSSGDALISCAHRSSGDPINQNKKTFLQKMNPKYLWQEHKKGVIGTSAALIVVTTTFYLTMKMVVNPIIRANIVPGAYWTRDCLNTRYHIPLGELRPTERTERGVEVIYGRVDGAKTLVVYLMGNGDPIYVCSEVEEILGNKVSTLTLKYLKNRKFLDTCQLFSQEIEAKRSELGLGADQVRIVGRSMGGFIGCHLAAKHGYRVLPIVPPASMASAFDCMTWGWIPQFCSNPFIWGAGWSGDSVNKFLEIAQQADGKGNAEFIFAEYDEIVGPGFKKQLAELAQQDPKLKARLDLPCSDPQSIAGHCLGNVGHNDHYQNLKCKNCGKTYQKMIADFTMAP